LRTPFSSGNRLSATTLSRIACVSFTTSTDD
jgi:hypothetical protein